MNQMQMWRDEAKVVRFTATGVSLRDHELSFSVTTQSGTPVFARHTADFTVSGSVASCSIDLSGLEGEGEEETELDWAFEAAGIARVEGTLTVIKGVG